MSTYFFVVIFIVDHHGTLYMGVTITVGYKCHNSGVMIKFISHTYRNRKVGILDPLSKMLYNVKIGPSP